MRISAFNIFFGLILFVFSLEMNAEIRYYNPADKEKVISIMKAASNGETIGERVMMAAKSMNGIPLGERADNDSIGTIMVRLDSIDRMAFLDIAIAAAQASFLTSPSLNDFENKLEGVSRRKGKDDGFASQFYYAADWIVDNIYRGNVKEMTEYVETGNYKTKTLDFLSHNPKLFPALADSAVLDKIKVMEMGFRSHKIPHLKKQSAGNKIFQELIQNGDIIIMLPPDPDFDIYDLGFVEIREGAPHLIHISKLTNEIVVEDVNLQRLFTLEGQHFYGFRWLRPID